MDLSGIIPSFGNFFIDAGAFIVALSIIVAVHEFGHYIVGRWSGIQAEVFSIGFGPRLWSRVDKHGTRWQIAAYPLGGYVKFLGDANAASAAADDVTMARLSPNERRHTMHGAPLWARASTVVAGPLFNFALSILIFGGVILSTGVATDSPVVAEVHAGPNGPGAVLPGDMILAVEGKEVPDWAALDGVISEMPSQPTLDYLVARDGAEIAVTGPALYPPRVAGVAPGSVADAAGLRTGDVFVAADGVPVYRFNDLQAAVAAAQGAAIKMTVWREGEAPFDLELAARRSDIPKPDGGFETRYLVGVSGGFFFQPATRDASLGEVALGAVSQTWAVVSLSVSGLWHMLIGAISSCNLLGPIGIAGAAGAAASEGLSNFIWFVAFLSTAVGFINLFPIPVLDGGHLVFHAWEWATGKPPPDRVLQVLMTIGIVLIVALMVLGLSNDTFRCP